ncbi:MULTISPECIES: AMP-binding protein [Psychrobacter]|uniref:AMP-binding protein n=2 Tax=Moraxellaceae TaxID=468 RepID=UPI00086EC791|nr:MULTISPECIES: AMP-binding protein [Psychrobacter]MBA6245295.1 AMP-binding protein [Psychrobacter sp. Urea-trap-18]MBA6285696.1 AMP-binding protein [Psychrobacter sp. Urea-trap-16]MBA6318943.1 AMP-binding protein [Psychrobacter sp. Urea-trap-20]MBA6333916.1 AMP-binding protein [Psychrobacter sp. Urea-trap-19]OEH68909.1 MAG: long-chain fatty acid--CoA ligase [Psychrobacter sp. B29-1]|tara:strand:- start:29999 stop:31699 length:1701 start_codon:yes stop_codon:yes gene_type:complete
MTVDKPWLAQYPENVPKTINPDQYESLIELYEECFNRFRMHPMTICMGVTHTYGDVDNASLAVAAWLQAQGLPKGSVVALMMPNVPQYLPTMIGILRAGYVCTPINPLYTGRELRHQLNDSGAQVIFVVDNFAQALEQVIEETNIKRIVLSKMGDMMGLKGILVNTVIRQVKRLVPKYNLNDPKYNVTKFPEVLKKGKNLPIQAPKTTLQQKAILQYTGGTTGLSKGAILTQRNVVAAAMQSEAWYRPVTSGINEVYINMVMALPLYHIFAFMLSLLGMRSGYTFILVPNPRDMPGFIKTLSKQPFHIFPAVNTLFKGLLDQPNFKDLDFSSLRITQAGGMAATEQTAARWLEVTGCPMVEGWGMTEGVAGGTANVITDRKFNGTIGIPVPSVDIIVIDENGERVGMHQAGEMCIKGPNVMSGYFNKDNSNDFTRDGYFRTGDIVSMDEKGYFTLLDRKKDMILVSGFNVFPNEIESVMLDCDGIVDCAVIGIPDENQGEAVKIYIVPADNNVTKEVIKEFALENLTGYKCPRHIEFVSELPKSNVGKVLRQKLREQHMSNNPQTL